MGEIRKLQKKLRQIENLELKVSLTLEERVKVSKKEELRARLAELLLQLSGPQQTLCVVGEEEDKMKRQVGNGTESHTDHTTAAKLAREDHQEKEESEKKREEKEQQKKKKAGQTHKPPDPDSEFKFLKAQWAAAKFHLRTLDGHSDIITCVVAVDKLVISGSRDTTVKVWHVPTATEQCNLGGHRGGVTCLIAPPAEYCRELASALHLPENEKFVLSGSSDCCVRIWALSSGQCVNSIYTFNAVSSLCFISEFAGYIVSGSDAGKLQVWDWLSQENRQSVNAHLNAITTLQSQGPLAFSGSADGRVCVWEVRDCKVEPLCRLQQWESNITGCIRPSDVTGRLMLSPCGDRIFLANGRSSIRVLDWRAGSVSRLTNHSSTAGVTDCVSQISELLIGSCYDLTSGESTINCTFPPSAVQTYLESCVLRHGKHRADVIVGSQVAGTSWFGNSFQEITKRGNVTMRRDSRLEDLLRESDSEEESDDPKEEEEEEEDDSTSKHALDLKEVAASSWLRCVLQ